MRFLVLYKMPAAGMEAWMRLPAEERAPQEKALMDKWNAWEATHAAAIKETAAAGKTKLVTAAGVTDISNDIMLYALVEAASADAAAEMFVGHPHFDIPEATIEIMPATTPPVMA